MLHPGLHSGAPLPGLEWGLVAFPSFARETKLGFVLLSFEFLACLA